MVADLNSASRHTKHRCLSTKAALSAKAGRDIPIRVTSGYRCPTLNALIGSSASSDHIKAMAADFTAPAFGTPFEVASALAPLVDDLQIGQLIFEHTWIHVSTKLQVKAVNRILTVQGQNEYEVGITG